MPSKKQPTPDDIDMVSMFGAVRRAITTLFIVTVVVGVSAYGILSTIAPRYTSEAQLSISAHSTNPFPEKRDGNASLAPRLDKQAINTHVRSLMAPDLIRSVSEQLQLRSRVEFNSAIGSLDLWSRVMRTLGLAGPALGQTDDERVLRVAYNQLQVAAANESRFISIRFASADPALAADFANRLAKTYREGLVSTPVKETSQVVRALQPKVDQLRNELIKAESEVERFRAETDQFRAGPQNTPVNDRRMSALTDELARAEAARSEADARWRTARAMLRSGSADVLPEVQRSPLIQNLINQRITVERDYSEASASLLPRHPRMRQLSANLSKLRQQITSEVRKVVASLQKDYTAAGLRAETAAAQIAKLKTKVVNTSGNEARLRALESDARSKRVELERLQKQLEDNKTMVNIRQVPIEAQIVSEARASSLPTFPRKGPYTLLAMAATFLLGLAWIIFRELVSGAYGASARPAGTARTPTAASATAVSSAPAPVEPKLAPLSGVTKDKASGKSTSPPIEMAEIASRIAKREGVENGYRTLIVDNGASNDIDHPGIELASQLTGRGQSVLIVDWDLSNHGTVSLSSGEPSPGMMELLADTATFEDAIRQIPGSTIQVVAPGAGVGDVAAMLEPAQLNMVLDALDEAYDQVIIAANHEDARRLFEAIEGRVDAGIRVLNADAASPDAAASFLGYDVEGIQLFDYRHPAASGVSNLRPPQKKGSGLLRHA